MMGLIFAKLWSLFCNQGEEKRADPAGTAEDGALGTRAPKTPRCGPVEGQQKLGVSDRRAVPGSPGVGRRGIGEESAVPGSRLGAFGQAKREAPNDASRAFSVSFEASSPSL